MNKIYIKLNNNNNHLSLGNLCRILKEQSLNKAFANQTNTFCAIFDLDRANESTINNYCLGARSIGSTYKEKYQNYLKKYQKDKTTMLPIILNITSILDGYIYTEEYEKTSFINNHNNLKITCNILYNLAKNDTTVPNTFTTKLNELLEKNTYYELICEILFYIILKKKQPIYIENIINDTISNILTHTNISLNNLESFLKLQFNDGTNYIYSLKQLANQNNPYACFELGLLEYKGEISGTPRYNKSYDYLKIAASYNHPRANYLIAKLLLDQLIGNNSKEDINLASKHLETAIKLGSVAALNTKGLLLLNENKEEESIKYFEKASKNNYVYAYNNLGKIYENKKEYSIALEYYLKSANLEECWACNKVGEMYRLGNNCDKDLKKAFYYYNQALEFPINEAASWAKYNLAKYFYLNGNYEANIEKDEQKAITLFQESNIIDAKLELLYIYANKYFKDKFNDILSEINILIDKIEKNPKFNKKYKQEIENTILKIKNNNQIDKNIFN